MTVWVRIHISLSMILLPGIFQRTGCFCICIQDQKVFEEETMQKEEFCTELSPLLSFEEITVI